MSLTELLPHVNAGFNTLVTVLLISGFVAIRRGNRTLHPRLMLSALGAGVAFLCGYLLRFGLTGHKRFPGDDWVRTLFLMILATHTLLAVAVVPMILRTIHLGVKESFAKHKRLARATLAIWLYVAVTGVVIYLMNNHVRPH